MNGISKAARDELEVIRQKKGGRLHPKDVVVFAKKPTCALHKYFDWDDSSAAEKFRLQQAGDIIRVAVSISEETGSPMRTYVSLSTDRGNGSGYRNIHEVLDDAALLNILMEDAKSDLESFQNKYIRLRRLAELSGLFNEIEKVVKPTQKATKKKEERATA